MKYILTDISKTIEDSSGNEIVLHKITYPDHPELNGGWIEHEGNLSLEGECCVLGDAMVYGHARVMGDAHVGRNVQVYGNSIIDGSAYVGDSAQVYDNAHVYGSAGIYNHAIVCGHANVCGDTIVCGSAHVYGTAFIRCDQGSYFSGHCCVHGGANISGHILIGDDVDISGSACLKGSVRINGNAVISSDKDYIVFKNNWSSGRYFVWTWSNNKWSVGCFYGTGKELIERAYRDSEEIGKNYEAYVKFVETLHELNAQTDEREG